MVMEWPERVYVHDAKSDDSECDISHGWYLYSNHNRCQWVYEYMYNGCRSESATNVYSNLQQPSM